ncbi:MAG: MBL fold metallo-hydrolase [Acidobacteria bacterium]|nr:MBL fold metallo-hydrolase [Acidobacteriota bacterium]
MHRASTTLPFTLLLLAAAWSTRGQAKLETIERILPGVWFRQGDLDQYGHCNNIVIEMKDYLVVVDANYPSGARALMADIAKISRKPVRYVFDTHHHGDHAYGNAVWTQAGATTIAYRGVTEEMRRFEPQRWQADAAKRKDVASLNRDTAEPPQLTFDEAPFAIDDGTRRVEFHHFGWAHTRGDGFAYLPKEQVLCTGDAVTNGPYNGMGDGYAENWPKVVARARELKVKHVLPAHGPAGGPEILEGEQRFLETIYSAVHRQVMAGKNLDDLVELNNGQPARAKLALPDSVKHWVGSFYPGQIRDIYDEITQGKPFAAGAIHIPRLTKAPVLDGDLREWRELAFNDGEWDMARLRQSPWYDPRINRLTRHGSEPGTADDLRARYYMAWDDEYLYLGAEVHDNVNDVTDPSHEPKRWYYKDAICWFIEAPRDGKSEKFGEGDNAFCFVADTRKPDYGAWWRHGAPGRTYVEEPIPGGASTYTLKMTGTGGSFVLEARVRMAAVFGPASRAWRAPRTGDVWGLEIVHTDPDGGDYGGHFLLYGRGDDDATWTSATLTGAITPVERREK